MRLFSSLLPGSRKQEEPSKAFADRVLRWYDEYGRKDLPWQQQRDLYRVWISEVMLQQTQVSTVATYFPRFVQRFPDVNALADAELDDVLSLWSGLGYYVRARNLHRAAKMIRDQYDGHIPSSKEGLLDLPGIGRSTAGAILALALNQRHAILDGNVKRVFCRYHAVAGWPGQSQVERQLWDLAETCTPQKRVNDYTQAIMDLGATVCRRSNPACETCPLASDCEAHALGRTQDYPAPRPRKRLPTRQTRFVILRNRRQETLLERRPPSGIWGGLWSFPECDPGEDLEEWCRLHLGVRIKNATSLARIEHTFSHFRLSIEPWLLEVQDANPQPMADRDALWYNAEAALQLGLAAPVRELIENIGGNAP